MESDFFKLSEDYASGNLLDQTFKDSMMDVWALDDLTIPDAFLKSDDARLTPEFYNDDLLTFNTSPEASFADFEKSDEVLFSLSNSSDCEFTVEFDENPILSPGVDETVDLTTCDFVSQNPADVIPLPGTTQSIEIKDLKVRTVKIIGNRNSAGHSYPPLILSDEERRMLEKEGINLPSHYPLTKQEERDLKRIRRKIRNKISAQDSRKRKRVYVDTLEEKVKECKDENIALKKRVVSLEAENSTLVAQLGYLKTLLTKKMQQKSKNTHSEISTTAQPATCLLVLILSFGLFLAPNLKLESSKELAAAPAVKSSSLSPTAQTFSPFAGRSRSLLQQPMDEIPGEDFNESELRNDPPWPWNLNLTYNPAAKRTVLMDEWRFVATSNSSQEMDVILEMAVLQQ